MESFFEYNDRDWVSKVIIVYKFYEWCTFNSCGRQCPALTPISLAGPGPDVTSNA